MMGKQAGQIQMVIPDMNSVVPESHLLRQIKNCVNFDFMYEKTAPCSPGAGRTSVDPVILIKMLFIGCLYGIKSEQRLEQEVSLNLACRWFCGPDLIHGVPDHSTFSQNRRRHFKDARICRDIFNEIVLKCIQPGIVSGETVELINRSTIKYMEDLETGLSSMPDYIHQARKRGPGYLTGAGCYPADQRESDIILNHLK